MSNLRTPLAPTVSGTSADNFKTQRRLCALGRDVVRDLERDYHAHGARAIETLRKEEPWDYLRLLLSLTPPHPPNPEDWLSDFSDEHLDTLIRLVREALAEQRRLAQQDDGAAPE